MAWLRDIDIWFADHVFAFQQEHRRYALHLVKQPDEAEELVQEAYARLFARADWAGIANPHAFTMRIIRNLAIERFRRAHVVRIDQSAAFASVDLADHAPTPDVVAMDRSELHRVAEVMQEMPPRMREAIYLRRIEGLRPAQVAERMNISVSTVETHIKRALRLLVSGLAQPATQRKAEQTPPWEQAEKTETI
ncbi:RNA polymerase sigma factor [Hephaestia mangrovi]|uniref:RNA polymerase sigma factor n=1 Tax=Hephaestia mangrovi TaxID=2873268 RepID=UPI001CA6F768|nr:RNA polymerase sigma factor [Hephaestia mangrovi]MBY8828015.1 RNA polymerase sigma factor [Hephaestia mangrovi]